MKRNDSLLSIFYNKCKNNDLNEDEDSSSDADFVCNTDEANSDDESESSSSSSSISQISNDATLTNDTKMDLEVTEVTIKKEKISKHATQAKMKKPNNKIQKDSKLTLNGNNNHKSEQINESNKLIIKKEIKQHNVCCVCLNEQSDGVNELVSCDSCGFYTHEGCYGISDSDSKQSTSSSASTEPWFCNSCLFVNSNQIKIQNNQNKTDFRKIQCELCPNLECGLLKQIDNGRSVHMLCALYTPGVAFQDTDKLWPVVLDEINKSRWGEQACSLCEETQLSRTGICIKCDAGLCKTWFHVTCAQKNGYLVDPLQMNSSDPFLAYCKQHNEKALIKNRKINYLAMISNYNSIKMNNQRLFEVDPDKDRLIVKFENAKQNYEINMRKLNKPFVANVKAARMLTTCPSALKLLMSKATLANNVDAENKSSLNYSDQRFHSASSVTFSTNFVKYYFEREAKMNQYFKDTYEFKRSQIELTKEEIELRNKYESKLEERKNLQEKNSKIKDKFKLYINLCELLSNKPKFPHKLEILLSNDGAKQQKPINADSTLNKKSWSSKKELEAPSSSTKKQRTKSDDKTNSSTYNLNIDAECCECNKKTNSHLLIGCDTCKKYYHINCLDPPLANVPKKSKLYGWECSKCVRIKDKNNSSECEMEDTMADLNQSTRLKRERRQSKMFICDLDLAIANSNQSSKRVKSKTKNKNKKKDIKLNVYKKPRKLIKKLSTSTIEDKKSSDKSVEEERLENS